MLQQTAYVPVDPTKKLPEITASLLQHSLVVWVFFPAFAIIQFVIPQLAPTCEVGYTNWAFAVIVVVELHHVYAESRAWTATKALLNPPDLTVMRQLGVLKSRRFYMLIGVVEDLDIYTCLTFPFLVASCDDIFTQRWVRAWTAVPWIGGAVAALSRVVHFWGIALLLAMVNIVLLGVFGLVYVFQQARYQRDHELATAHTGTHEAVRISGEEFVTLARCAETAMMPSVAHLCAEMASQKRWSFDGTKCAAARTQANKDRRLGKLPSTIEVSLEQWDEEEREKVDSASVCHNTVVLVAKVLFGNVLQLWLQASFFSLGFDETGDEAKYKVGAGMAISAFQAISKTCGIASRAGALGYLLVLTIAFIVILAGLKIFFAYRCLDHVWNLSTGCVRMG